MFYFKAKYTIVAAGTEGFMLSLSTINKCKEETTCKFELSRK